MSIHPVIFAACPTLCRLASTHPELHDYLENLATHLQTQLNATDMVRYFLAEIEYEVESQLVEKANHEWRVLVQFIEAVLYGVEGAN